MDPARWGRVQELFHRAVDLEEPRRSGFLQKACGEDRSLLTVSSGCSTKTPAPRFWTAMWWKWQTTF